jgi:hypothetical protein
MVIEPVIRVHVAVGPVVSRVAMKVISPGAADDVFLNAAQAPVLRAIGVGHDANFFDIVKAQKQVAGTGVVQVQEKIILFRAIQCEVVRLARTD